MDSEEKGNHLDCPICLERYDEGPHTPKMMPCLHTMCASCLMTIVASLNTAAPPLPARQQLPSRAQPNPPEPTAEDDDNYEEPIVQSQDTSRTSNARRPNNEVISAVANIIQRHKGHPMLRRISGHGPITSPTSPLSPRASPFSPSTTPFFHSASSSTPSAAPLPPSSSSLATSSSSTSSGDPIYAVSGPPPTQSNSSVRNPNDPLPTPPQQQSTPQRPFSPPPPPPPASQSTQPTPPTNTNTQPTPPQPNPPPTQSTDTNAPPPLPARPSGLRNTGAVYAQPQPRVKTPRPLVVVKETNEPLILRDKIIQCPLCRSDVNTSSLQTNRYVLAHLKDLARLTALATTQQPPEETATPSATAPEFKPTDYWCVSCDTPAHLDCSPHKLSPLICWMETLKASADELEGRVKRDLELHSTDLEDMEKDMNTVIKTLNKAYIHLMKMKEDTWKLVKDMKKLPGETGQGVGPTEQAQAVSNRMTKLRQVRERVRKLESGSDSSDVYVYRQSNKLYISTSHPDTTLIITINHGHAIDV